MDGKRRRDLVIGYWKSKDGRERPLHLREQHRSVHTAIFGGSGSGKSYLMEHMIREDIRRGRGVCVLDPKGDLYNRLVRYCYLNEYTRKLVLINPHEERWAVGLNYLECDLKATSAVTHAQTVARGINKVYGDEDPDEKPQLTRWLENTIAALVAARLTLEDAQLFLTNPHVRNRILTAIGNPYLASEWQVFEKATDRNRDDWLAPVLNRLARFYKSDVTRRIIGQQASGVDFRKAIDDGAIILANLAPGGFVSRQESRMLGVILIDKITSAARSRVDIREHQRRRTYLYLDEFHNYLCEDIALGLKELRGFGLSFVLATQELAPIHKDQFAIYSAIQANTDIKIAFAVQPDDVELLTYNLFPEYLAGDQRKRELERTFFRPVLGRAQSYSYSGSSARSSSESHSTSSGRTSFSGYSGSTSEGESEQVGNTLIPDNEGGYRFGPVSDTHTASKGSSEGYSEGEGTSESETHGTSQGESRASGWSVSDSPFYYLEEDSEVSAIEDYTPEEKRLHIMAKLVTLPKRHAVIKVRGKPGDAISIRTPELKTTQQVIDKYFQQKLQSVYERTALPAVRVDTLIESRRHDLLRLPAHNPNDDDFTYNEHDVKRDSKAPVKVQKGRKRSG